MSKNSVQKFDLSSLNRSTLSKQYSRAIKLFWIKLLLIVLTIAIAFCFVASVKYLAAFRLDSPWVLTWSLVFSLFLWKMCSEFQMTKQGINFSNITFFLYTEKQKKLKIKPFCFENAPQWQWIFSYSELFRILGELSYLLD